MSEGSRNGIKSYQVAVGEANQHPAPAIDRLGEKFEQPLVYAGIDIIRIMQGVHRAIVA